MDTTEFNFPDLDEIGIDTLDAISFAPNFNKWMYQTISPHCSGKILEIGSGIGNISSHFIHSGADIHLSEIRDNYIAILNSTFKDKNVSVIKMDITDPDFDNHFASSFETYDSIFALNVIEHIKDDHLAIRNAKKLLKPGGKLIILVPAFQFMYNSFDTALEHYRRYTKANLNRLMQKEFSIVHNQYFNFFGMFGWFVSGKLLKKKSIPKNQMQLYDRLLFIAKILDKIVFNKIGLSVISVGKK